MKTTRSRRSATAVTLTLDIARAAGADAGNRSMRAAGRSAWSEDDLNAAGERTMRLAVLGGHLPVQCYEMSGYGPFPFVQGNDGSWIKLNPNT